MDSSLDNDLDKDSLSSENLSKDSLTNDQNDEESDVKVNVTKIKMKRQGSYTLETSPMMSESIREITNDETHLKENSRKSLTNHNKKSTSNNMMSKSMIDRPWQSTRKNISINSALAKQREEKLKLAKEEQQRRQQLKMDNLKQTTKMAESVYKRKEEETQRKLEEKKRRDQERKRIVEERRQRLEKAEEMRKAKLLEKLVNKEHKSSTIINSNSVNMMMTMSCYGGIGYDSSHSNNMRRQQLNRDHNKEVVSRFWQSRPVSSTGKVFGFGSSTPRPICHDKPANNPSTLSENIKKPLPEWLKERLDILSRPSTARSTMMTSVMEDSTSQTNQKRTFNRQSSLRIKSANSQETSSRMTTSVIDFSKSPNQNSLNRRNIRKITNVRKPTEMSTSMSHSTYNTSVKLNSELKEPKKLKPSRSFNKKKLENHFDSDSIDEDNILKTRRTQQQNNNNKKRINKLFTKQEASSDSLDSDHNKKVLSDLPVVKLNGEIKEVKSSNEIDYKSRLMENRRLAREKRERELENQMKAEREKKLIEEALIKENMGINNISKIEESSEECQFTTSNDEVSYEPGTSTLNSQIEDNSLVTIQDPDDNNMEVSNDNLEPVSTSDNRNNNSDTKKRLESIMSRFKKPQATAEDSSSDCGGLSPRRAMSPEPSELEGSIVLQKSDILPNSNLQFKSSILQSMVNKGRLTINPVKTANDAPDLDDSVQQTPDSTLPHNSTVLSSVQESEDDNGLNSRSSAAMRSSGIEGNSLSDANSDFVQDHSVTIKKSSNGDHQNDDRGICDGKEDSQSVHEPNLSPMKDMNRDSVERQCSSVSSVETEELNGTNTEKQNSDFSEITKESIAINS